MSEQIKELTDEVEHIENDTSKEYDEQVTQEETTKKKLSKKKLGIIVAIVAVVAIVLLIVFMPNKFDKVENKCTQIAGYITTGKGYFKIETNPDNWPFMNADDALAAIRYANDELGFPGVYSQMLNTSAIMGRQTDENSKYKVSWTYHPDDGLTVIYSKK